jgi:hypothetical protein
MSQDSASSSGNNVTPASSASPEQPDHVYLVSYPKIVFLYPTVLTALFCSIVMWAKGDVPVDEVAAWEVRNQTTYMRAAITTQDSTPADAAQAAPSEAAPTEAAPTESSTSETPDATAPVQTIQIHSYHNVCARIFLIVFGLNMVVISFDFPRTTSLTWFFAIATILIGLWLLLSKFPDLAPKIVQGLLSIKPWANASFYMIFTMIMLFLYMWVLISRRFDYWEVKGNELLHHHGFLSNLIRYSAPNLRIDKEINDLFEYMLLRSGRLIIHASNERRAIVLENVLFINAKEDRITRMLGALQVRVRTDKE